MNRKTLALAPLLALLSSACIVSPDRDLLLDVQARVQTQHNHRGMVQNDEGVLQAELQVDFPLRDGGSLVVSTLGNMDLSDDTGDAWFPDGHASRFTEVDYTASYSRHVHGFDLTAGILSYVFPNGLEFPNGERGETRELFVAVGRDLRGFYPELRIHYDFDEAEGVYLRGGVSRQFELRQRLEAELEVHAGWSSGGESEWNYGIDESGLADVGASGTLSYAYDENTRLFGTLAGSTIVDGDIRDWFDVIGIESDNVWVALGVGWSF